MRKEESYQSYLTYSPPLCHLVLVCLVRFYFNWEEIETLFTMFSVVFGLILSTVPHYPHTIDCASSAVSAVDGHFV